MRTKAAGGRRAEELVRVRRGYSKDLRGALAVDEDVVAREREVLEDLKEIVVRLLDRLPAAYGAKERTHDHPVLGVVGGERVRVVQPPELLALAKQRDDLLARHLTSRSEGGPGF